MPLYHGNELLVGAPSIALTHCNHCALSGLGGKGSNYGRNSGRCRGAY